jgi:hypothetical protein
MWGNPMREREILLFSFRKVQYNSKITFPAKRNTSQPQKKSPKMFCLGKYAQVHTAVRPPLNLCLEKCAQQSVVQPAQYGPTTTRKLKISTSIFVPKGASKTMPSFLVYGLYGSVQYSPTQKNRTTLTQKNALGFVPSFFLGNVLSKLLTFLSQAYSKNLSLTSSSLLDVSCTHYPMHSFINLKMTFSLQTVFSPSPTLNPKAKIRSCLFQDQGS